MPNSARVSVPTRQKSSTSRPSISRPSLAARHQRHEKIPESAHRDRETIVMAKTVADQFAETLAAAGVKRIYGIVGDSLNGLTDAIRRQGKIEWGHARHEEVAAFAAGAEAHLTGELAVCAGSCGPGNLHLVNGLFDCHRSRVPCSRSPRKSPRPRSEAAIFRKPTRRNYFASAAIIANWYPRPVRCRECWRSPSGRRSASTASPWW